MNLETQQVAESIRAFMSDELMMSHAAYVGEQDDLNLDSLGLTELRLFLSEKFGIETGVDALPAENCRNLASLCRHVVEHAALSCAA